MKNIVIKDHELHLRLKKVSVEKGASLIDVVEKAVKEYCEKNEKKG